MPPFLLAVEATEPALECDAFDVLCQSDLPLVGDRIREMFLTMAAGVLESVAAWWAEVPSLSVTGGFGSQMRAYAVALSVAMLVLGLVIQGGRMIWMRRAAPLVDAVTGVSTYVIVVAVAVPIAAGALVVGDVFASALLADEVDQQVAARVVAELAATPQTGVVVLLGLLASLAGVVLAGIMLLREVAVLLLAATLPVAAAGRLMPGIGDWLPSVLRWVAALVLWKPAAALVYAAGHQLMTPDEPRSLLVGVATLGLTVAVLPALARWLTPAARTTARGLLGGGSAMAAAGGSGLVARGPTMQQQVARIERDFGSPAGRQVPPPGTAAAGAASAAAASAGVMTAPHVPGTLEPDAATEDTGSATDDQDADPMVNGHAEFTAVTSHTPLWGINGNGNRNGNGNGNGNGRPRGAR